MTLVLVDSQTVDDSFRWIGSGDGVTKRGTLYTASATRTIVAIEVKIARENGATGNVVVEVWTNSSGVPGSLIAANTPAVDVTTIPTVAAPDFVRFLYTGWSQVASTQYIIVVYGDNGANGFGTGDIHWHRNTTSATGFNISAYDTGSWVVASTDQQHDFKTYYDDAGGGGGGSFRNFYGSKFYGAQYAPVTPIERNLAVARYQRERAAEMRRFMAKVERRAA